MHKGIQSHIKWPVFPVHTKGEGWYFAFKSIWGKTPEQDLQDQPFYYVHAVKKKQQTFFRICYHLIKNYYVITFHFFFYWFVVYQYLLYFLWNLLLFFFSTIILNLVRWSRQNTVNFSVNNKLFIFYSFNLLIAFVFIKIFIKIMKCIILFAIKYLISTNIRSFSSIL